MKILIFVSALIICLSHNANSQDITYDSVYANQLGADEYGMKKYVMAFLKTGKVKMTDETESQKLQIEHLKNITKMANEGKLVLAGPFLNDQEIRGIYIFNVTTIEEAKQLTETDPAIIAGVFEMELMPWYGSAALVELTGIHKKVQKSTF